MREYSLWRLYCFLCGMSISLVLGMLGLL